MGVMNAGTVGVDVVDVGGGGGGVKDAWGSKSR